MVVLSPRMKQAALPVLIVLLVIWGLTDVRSRARFDPQHPEKHRTDLTVFTEAGAAFFDGRDPYEITSPRGWKYLYPPFFALVMAPLHGLDPQAQGVIWFFLSLAMAWGCVAESRRLWHLLKIPDSSYSHPRFTAWTGGCAFLAALIPALDCLQRGQVGLLKTWLLLLGFRLVLESRTLGRGFAGGLVLALPCVIKVIPVLPVGVLLFMLLIGVFRIPQERPRWLPAATLAGVVAGGLLWVLILPAALTGWQTNLDHLNSWVTKIGSRSSGIGDTQRLGEPHGLRNQSLDNALFWLGNVVYYRDRSSLGYYLQHAPKTFMAQPGPRNTVKGIRVALVLVLLPLAWRVARWGRGVDQAAVFGLACVAALLVSPVARGHYFMFLVAAWLFVPLALHQRGRLRTARYLALAAPLLVVPHYLFLFTLGSLGYLGIGTALWYLAAVGWIGWAGLRPSGKQAIPPASPGTCPDPTQNP